MHLKGIVKKMTFPDVTVNKKPYVTVTINLMAT